MAWQAELPPCRGKRVSVTQDPWLPGWILGLGQETFICALPRCRSGPGPSGVRCIVTGVHSSKPKARGRFDTTRVM